MGGENGRVGDDDEAADAEERQLDRAPVLARNHLAHAVGEVGRVQPLLHLLHLPYPCSRHLPYFDPVTYQRLHPSHAHTCSRECHVARLSHHGKTYSWPHML